MFIRKRSFFVILFYFFLFNSCQHQNNISHSSFDFLIGEWKMYNAMKGTETIMNWTKSENVFSAILESKSDIYSQYNFTTKYSIYKKSGKWYWYSNHTSQTNQPSYHYELRKDYVPKHPEAKIFFGKPNNGIKTTFQLYWDTKKLLVKYSMFTNGYVFEKVN